MEEGAKKVFKRDNTQTDLLIKSGKRSAAEALRESKALGLTVTYIQKGSIIEELPNGSRKVIKNIAPAPSEIKLKKGMVLYAKK